MIVSLIRTVYSLRLKAENTAVTEADHDSTHFVYKGDDYLILFWTQNN